jgi:hypothetical protein
MTVEGSAFGTARAAQRPLVSRYSPTDVRLTSRLEVPNATHELLVVHPTEESGTEMLIAGRPVTCGDATVGVAHDANTAPATEHIAATRTSERTWAGTRIIVSLRS